MSDNATLVERLTLVDTDEIIDAAEIGCGWLVSLTAEAAARIAELEADLARADAIIDWNKNDWGTARIAELEAALERLASNETMTTPFALGASPAHKELVARMDFARAAIRARPAP